MHTVDEGILTYKEICFVKFNHSSYTVPYGKMKNDSINDVNACHDIRDIRIGNFNVF